jgi:hypothetical protein
MEAILVRLAEVFRVLKHSFHITHQLWQGPASIGINDDRTRKR